MNRGPSIQFGVPMTRTIKILIAINVFVWFFLQVIFEKQMGFAFSKFFALFPGKVIFDFNIWQLFTYQFLHTNSVTHILFNMLMLWWLGSELEQRWGRKFFLFYYLTSGVGAAVIYCLGVGGYAYFKGSVTPSLVIPVMGASGAIFGLLVAYGIIFGERMIHFMMLFPMKAKHMVMIMGAIEIASLFNSQEGGSGDVAYLAHLGGLASGYLILMFWNRYQRHEWNQKAKKRQSKLKLVVNNDKTKTGEGPKYWN